MTQQQHPQQHSLYRLWVAGSNSGGQLGIAHHLNAHTLVPAHAHASTTSFPPSAGWRIESLSSGANHTAAILLNEHDTHWCDRQVWITGTPAQGQLGPVQAQTATSPLTTFRPLDLRTEVLQPLVVAAQLQPDAIEAYTPHLVACGWNSTYLVLRRPASGDQRSDDIIVSLGLAKDNTFGELGLPDPPASASVHLVDLRAALSGTSRSTAYSVLKIATGLRHVVVLVASEDEGESDAVTLSLVGWGSARHGQVGEMTKLPSTTMGSKNSRPGPSPAIARTPQLMRTCQLSRDSINGGNSGCPAFDLAAGRDHTVALMSNDLAFFGSNRQGQCALANHVPPNASIASVSCNWNGTSILLRHSDGSTSVLSTGNNSKGQFGAAPSPAASGPSQTSMSPIGDDGIVTSLASGSEHTLLLITRDSQREVWGTGWNEHGNLAQSDEVDRHLACRLVLPSVHCQPLSIWAGCGTTFIQTLCPSHAPREPDIDPHAR